MIWKLIGGGVICAIAIALGLRLIDGFGDARFEAGRLAERSEWQTGALEQQQAIADQRLADSQRVTAAVGQYADKLARLEPVIVHSTDTVTRYAQTPFGAAPCLAADRVRGIDATAAALGLHPPADPAAAGLAVPANPDPDAGGR